jgi:hypothetical protein
MVKINQRNLLLSTITTERRRFQHVFVDPVRPPSSRQQFWWIADRRFLVQHWWMMLLSDRHRTHPLMLGNG